MWHWSSLSVWLWASARFLCSGKLTWEIYARHTKDFSSFFRSLCAVISLSLNTAQSCLLTVHVCWLMPGNKTNQGQATKQKEKSHLMLTFYWTWSKISGSFCVAQSVEHNLRCPWHSYFVFCEAFLISVSLTDPMAWPVRKLIQRNVSVFMITAECGAGSFYNV